MFRFSSGRPLWRASAALLIEGLRASVFSAASLQSLLQRSVSAGGAGLVSTVRRGRISRHGGGAREASRAIPPISRACPSADRSRPAGARAGGLVRGLRGPSPPQCWKKVFLSAARLLRAVCCFTALSGAEVLLRVVPSSVTSRAAPGGPLVETAAGLVQVSAARRRWRWFCGGVRWTKLGTAYRPRRGAVVIVPANTRLCVRPGRRERVPVRSLAGRCVCPWAGPSRQLPFSRSLRVEAAGGACHVEEVWDAAYLAGGRTAGVAAGGVGRALSPVSVERAGGGAGDGGLAAAVRSDVAGGGLRAGGARCWWMGSSG